MLLEKLTLTNFRNYSQKSFLLSPKLTIVVGPNTAGKTSILEAVMLIASGKSFRADRESEMIQTGFEVARVKAEISAGKAMQENENTSQIDSVEVVLTTGSVQGRKTPYKQFKLNGVGKRQSDIVSTLPSVLFWPEDLSLIVGTPSLRRRYLDTVLSQANRAYARSLKSYEKSLRVRNRLLHSLREGIPIKQDEVSYWEEQLIDHGAYIHDQRNIFLNFLNEFSIENGSRKSFNVVYDHSVVSRDRFKQYYYQERASGVTLVGPHRDDIVVYKGEKPVEHDHLRKFGSRGEQRLGVLWMKLAELSFLEKHLNIKPLLLLDDILSELDEGHRGLVTSLLDKQQTIMTTTDSSNIHKSIVFKSDSIKLKS